MYVKIYRFGKTLSKHHTVAIRYVHTPESLYSLYKSVRAGIVSFV